MLHLLDSNSIALQSYSGCFEVANHERVIKKGIEGPLIKGNKSNCLRNSKGIKKQHNPYCSSICLFMINNLLIVIPSITIVINQKKKKMNRNLTSSR